MLLFPRDLLRDARWADIVHICDHSNGMYTRYLRGVPHLVTCHDMLAVRSALGEIPANPTRWSGRQLQRMILSGLSRAARIACVSAATRADVTRLTGIPQDRTAIVPNGLNYPYTPMPARQSSERLAKLGVKTDSPLILHVGGNQWYKNRLGVLGIFAHLRRRGVEATLLMAGKPWTEPMRRFVGDQGLTRHVVEIHSVGNEDLRALYSSAHVFLFPSLQEGFGWPVIEAQACGCPVATSDRAPLTEIVGGTAVLLAPEDPETAARILASRWESLGELRAAGLANAARFSLDSMLDGYLHEYATVCAQPSVSM